MRIAILGSGPNAFAAYKALEKTNHTVTILDFGLSEMIKESSLAGLAGKHHRNSFMSMQLPEVFKSRSNLHGGVMGSSAFGGWSNVWGATIFPLTESELEFWNLDRKRILNQQHYLSVKLDLFNLTVEDPDVRSHKGISGHVYSNQNKLNQSDHLQISNLAISRVSDSQETGCIQCGACLLGCPYDHIWNARIEWQKIEATNKLKFERGIWIRELKEEDGRVILQGEKNGITHEYIFDKVFVALGAYQTAGLMIRSGVRDTIVIKDSPMVVLPFFLPFFQKTLPSRPGVTLSSAFASTTFTTRRPTSQVHDFFAQVYGHSDDLEARILDQVPILRLFPVILKKFIFDRIGIAMCFFDESFGGAINARLNHAGEVEFTTQKHVSRGFHLKRMARKNLRKFKLRTIPCLGFLGKVGLGYHSGASFPHKTEPHTSNENYSDYLGRPNGSLNIHLVDTSVFPRIGSSPPTFNSMVNAHRIVEETLDLYSED
jgi:ferredoxin